MALGISIYPGKSSVDANIAYIDAAFKLGYTRVFTSLLELDGDPELFLDNFKSIIRYAANMKMEVVVDINPKIFDVLGIKHDDLKVLADLGIYGLRLDMGFTGKEEAEMTHNPYGLKIEINMSMGTRYVDNIMSFSPDSKNLIGSHNFYPMRFSGLDVDFFVNESKKFDAYKLRTAAFITSQEGKLGPWPVQDGLVSLEMHRDWPIDVQVKFYKLTQYVDDVIIGNAFASLYELEMAAKAYRMRYIEFDATVFDGLSLIESAIVYDELHSYRGDFNGYMIRSSLPRFKYKEHDIPIRNCVDIKTGDIMIANNAYGQYKGELHIALKPMKNYGTLNVIGRLDDQSIILLDYFSTWSKFTIKKGEH